MKILRFNAEGKMAYDVASSLLIRHLVCDVIILIPKIEHHIKSQSHPETDTPRNFDMKNQIEHISSIVP